MTVKELRKNLKQYPSDMRVVVNGYEGGYQDVTDKLFRKVDLKLNYFDIEEEWWNGPHDSTWYDDEKFDETAIVIER